MLKSLIENCTSRNMLNMDTWVNPILYAMSDVIIKNDAELLTAYTDLLTCCMHSFTNKVNPSIKIKIIRKSRYLKSLEKVIFGQF